uniref:hypothetical protein n=1 Tax=Alistipes putredinis TaxID=28117 RepID=UPI003FD8E51F
MIVFSFAFFISKNVNFFHPGLPVTVRIRSLPAFSAIRLPIRKIVPISHFDSNILCNKLKNNVLPPHE